MKTIHTAFILFSSVFCCDVSTSYAYTSQEIINALTQAGQAYWEQRVVIDQHRENILWVLRGANRQRRGRDSLLRYRRDFCY